jgi:hypothetical protein
MMDIFGKMRIPKAFSSETSTAEPTDDHDHEHLDDDAQVQRVMHRIAGDLQRAAERCEKDT